MQFLNIINEILAPNKHNINFGSLNMTVQRMPNILQYVLQYALAVSYRIAIRLQPQYPPLRMMQVRMKLMKMRACFTQRERRKLAQKV